MRSSTPNSRKRLIPISSNDLTRGAATRNPRAAAPARVDDYAAVPIDIGLQGAPAVIPGRIARVARFRPWAIIGGLIVPVVLVAVWAAISESGLLPSYRLPSPILVWEAAVDMVQRGLLQQYSAISTQRVLTGFGIGAGVGIVLGSIVGLSRRLSILLSPTIGAIRAVPSLAWVPLLGIYLGIGEVPKIVLIAIGAAFPVYTTVAGALRHVDRSLVEMGRAFGLSPFALFTTVQLPAVIPSVVSGLRLALAQSWLFLVAAELLASSMGLGFLLIDSQNNGRVDRLFLAIICLAILGKLTDALIGLLERWLLKRWG
jgi:sulfonate transport system permease protein